MRCAADALNEAAVFRRVCSAAAGLLIRTPPYEAVPVAGFVSRAGRRRRAGLRVLFSSLLRSRSLYCLGAR